MKTPPVLSRWASAAFLAITISNNNGMVEPHESPATIRDTAKMAAKTATRPGV